MSDKTDPANDYALAKILNDRVINIFTLVVDPKNTPDTSAVNRSYVKLVEELKRIYDRQPELQKAGQPICWKVIGNLEQIQDTAIEYTLFANDYGQEHNSNVNTLCINANVDKPTLSPEITKLISVADKNVKEYKTELDKMYATVAFEGMVIPVVTIGETKYFLPAMREGLAYNVISFCLAKHPNQEISLDALKAEMKNENFSVFGLSNFNNDTYKSIFGKSNPLSPFLISAPKKIRVNKTAALTDEQIAEIAKVSTKISE